MKKLFLAILGLFPLDQQYNRADQFKYSYYHNVDRKNCFCGGEIQSKKIKFVLNDWATILQNKPAKKITKIRKVKICNQCQMMYEHER